MRPFGPPLQGLGCAGDGYPGRCPELVCDAPLALLFEAVGGFMPLIDRSMRRRCVPRGASSRRAAALVSSSKLDPRLRGDDEQARSSPLNCEINPQRSRLAAPFVGSVKLDPRLRGDGEHARSDQLKRKLNPQKSRLAAAFVGSWKLDPRFRGDDEPSRG